MNASGHELTRLTKASIFPRLRAAMPFLPAQVDSLDLARYLIARVGPMPHLKLQKLVYYVQSWHLAILDQPIIKDDFQAWAHGPVCRKVWNEFKSEDKPVMGEVALDSKAAKSIKAAFPAKVTKDQLEVIDDVIEEYGDKSAYHLECLTHAETPWRDARAGLDPSAKSTNVITQDSIRRFFKSRLKV